MVDIKMCSTDPKIQPGAGVCVSISTYFYYMNVTLWKDLALYQLSAKQE